MSAVFLWLLLVYVGSAIAVKKIPDFVPICKRDDPKINECYANSFNVLVRRLGGGMPQMNLRKVDPLMVEKITLDQGSQGSLGFKADLEDMEMYGLSNLIAEKADIDMKRLVFKVNLTAPRIYMASKLRVKGRVLLFQLDSNGTFTGNLTGVHIKGIWQGFESTRKGKIHVEFKIPDLTVDIDDIKMNFDNLLPTKELNEHTNQVINENIDVLYDEMRPVIAETVKSIIVDSVNSVYKLFPLDVLFPK